jgi:hypothetical protein
VVLIRNRSQSISCRQPTSQRKPIIPQQQQHHDVGLPSVWSESSVHRPASASLSLFQMQGTYERPAPASSVHSPQNSLSSFANDFNWEQTARPRTTESQYPPRGRDLRANQQVGTGHLPKSRPRSSLRSATAAASSSRPTTAQSVEELLSAHQLNQYHKSRKFLSSR